MTIVSDAVFSCERKNKRNMKEDGHNAVLRVISKGNEGIDFIARDSHVAWVYWNICS